MKITVFPAILVFWGFIKQSESPFLISVSGSCFLFLFCLFCSRCYFVFVFMFVLLFCFESQYISFLFCILCYCCCCCFLVFVALVFCYFLDFGYLSKHLSKTWKSRKLPKWKLQEKLTKAVSTDVFTNSVCFSFLCVFKICMFCWKHYKNSGFCKKTTKMTPFPKVKTGPSQSLKLVQVCCAIKLDQLLTLTIVFWFVVVFVFLFNILLSAGRTRFSITKKWTSF